MNENFSNQFENKSEDKEQKKAVFIALAVELCENKEGFDFPGINPDDYVKIKADRDEYPEFFTPIEELMERFKNEGMKVMLGSHPENGEVFIMPLHSNDIENDSIYPKYLQIGEIADEQLKNLVLANKS